eukprot:TRINITY_DN43382_c0_g1_i1.p1 TRINITY_DN43382_c0_g1~~TRINITY_DN43382_c0_g1_i1.p1  ORF type:complete len:845 (+),score=308.68 TRINITY_DN43382_c0_g1_i1:55-2589(+)
MRVLSGVLLAAAAAVAEPPAAAIRPGEHFKWNEPLTYVVFGATGDLAKKKLYPAFSELIRHGWLPPHINIIGYGRSDYTMEKLWAKQAVNVKGPDSHRDQIYSRCEYFRGGYDSEADHQRLDARIRELVGDSGPDNRVLFLAVPPSSFGPICASATKHLRSRNGITRVIVEKPFGRDAETFAELNKITSSAFHDSEIYRLDHYLGKEVIMNFVTQRFANAVLEPSWNREHIASVEVNWQEDIGLDGRGGYFDDVGIIRDVMQNHLLQVMIFVAMDRPATLNATDLIAAKTALLKAVKTLTPDDVVVGQYGRGVSQRGDELGYLDDKTVPAGSKAVTYALLHLQIDNDRWRGVPFLMKAGKALNERMCEVRVTFKSAAGGLFGGVAPNELVMRIQPGEALYLKMQTKRPGLLPGAASTTTMDFKYTDTFTKERIADAYERVMLNTARGDQSLFIGTDELTEAWRIFSPLLHHLDDAPTAPHTYAFGTQGPEAAAAFLTARGVQIRPSYEAHLCSAVGTPTRLRSVFESAAGGGTSIAVDSFRTYLRAFYDGRDEPAQKKAPFALKVHDGDGDGTATFDEFAAGAAALCERLYSAAGTCGADGCGAVASPLRVADARADVVAELRSAVLDAERKALSQSSRFSIAVSGGSLASLLGEALAGADADWAKWHVFFADERAVPSDHADSNYRAFAEAVLPAAPIPPANIHAAAFGGDVEAMAAEYEKVLTRELGDKAELDLLLLGMGPDGHTMSLFPGHPLLHESVRLVAAVMDSPKPPAQRVTLTLPVAAAAKGVVFVVTGAAKAEAVKRAIVPTSGDNPFATPSGMVASSVHSETWIVDKSAAALLP